MKLAKLAFVVLLAFTTTALAEAGGNGKGNGRQDNGLSNPPGTYNNNNRQPGTGNGPYDSSGACAGGMCGVDGPYHAKGVGWPGQGDGVGTQ